FQHRAGLEADLVQLQPLQLFSNQMSRPRQKTRMNAISHTAEPEVQAGWLDLVIIQWALRFERALAEKSGNFRIRQYACLQHIEPPRFRAGALPRLAIDARTIRD